MNSKILVGSDEGAYTVTNGARTITITGLSWTLTTEQLAFIFNKTQNLLYYAPAPDLALASVSAGVITIDSSLPVLVTADVLHIQVWKPNEGFDITLDTSKVTVQNPEYGHYTSVETLVSEDDPSNNATADAVSSTTVLTDASGAFSVANVAVGYEAYDISEASAAVTVISVDSATAITTDAVTDWSGDEYQLPVVKRYEINMEGYSALTLHYRFYTAVSQTAYMKIYGTLDSTATVDSDVSWVNLSATLLGGAAGITATGTQVTTEGIVNCTPTAFPMLKYMVKMVWEKSTTSAPSGSLFTVFVKKSS